MLTFVSEVQLDFWENVFLKKFILKLLNKMSREKKKKTAQKERYEFEFDKEVIKTLSLLII